MEHWLDHSLNYGSVSLHWSPNGLWWTSCVFFSQCVFVCWSTRGKTCLTYQWPAGSLSPRPDWSLLAEALCHNLLCAVFLFCSAHPSLSVIKTHSFANVSHGDANPYILCLTSRRVNNWPIRCSLCLLVEQAATARSGLTVWAANTIKSLSFV